MVDVEKLFEIDKDPHNSTILEMNKIALTSFWNW